jgi:hypothetical protein
VADGVATVDQHHLVLLLVVAELVDYYKALLE